MLAGLKPYPQMRDSGVEWLGNVPAHWTVERLKSSIEEVVELGTERQDKDLYVALDRVESWTGRIKRTDTGFPADSQLKRFRAGDVLFGKLRPYLAKVARPISDGLCVGEFLVLRPRGRAYARGYLEQLLRSKPVIDAIDSSTFGARMPRADWNFIGCMPVIRPPHEEQSAIARFLDHATDRIDRYIRAKEKLIALLDEYKQVLIHQAVTGQFDVRTGEPYSEYKESGEEWLGRVPRHWGVLHLGRITLDRCDGPFGSGLKSSHYTPDGIRVVRLQNIGHSEFNEADVAYIAPEHYATLGDHSVEPGDVLIAGLGDERHPAGRACIAPKTIVPAMVKADCFRFRLDKKIAHPEFIALHLTATATAATATLSTGATRQRINLQSTSSRRILLPPLFEQLQIVEHTSRQTSSIRIMEQLARQEIGFLRDYRSRLIADAVTGKLDVREVADTLPDIDPLASDNQKEPE